MIDLARANDTLPILTLTPFGPDGMFSNYLISALVNDPEVQQNLIDNLLQTMEEKNYGGIDIDFEYILAEDRIAFAEFVTRVRMAANAAGYPVSVALAPKTSDDQPGLLYGGKDYRLLGSVFFISEMGGHGNLVEFNDRIVCNGDFHRFRVADRTCGGNAFFIGERPVISVIWNAKVNFFRRNACKGVFHYFPYFMNGGDSHGRPISIAPFISHKQYMVGSLSQQPVIFASVQKSGLIVRGFRR